MKKILQLQILFTVFLLSFLVNEGCTQDMFKRKAIYAELFGAGGYGSINYDFRFRPDNSGCGARFGIGYWPTGIIFPIEINGLVGKKRFSFEYGVGISIALYDDRFSETYGIIPFAKIGVRFKPIDSGLFANLYWNPSLNPDGFFLGWFGLGLGYSWKKQIN